MRRRGHTLVECMIAMGLIAATFTTVAVSMHGVCRSDRRVRDDLTAELALCRFAAQFRSDAHQARKAHLEEGSTPQSQGSALVLTMPDDRTVRYALAAHRVERVLERGGKVQQRETYELPAALQPRWEMAGDEVRPVASLLLEPVASPRPSEFRPLRTDAAVGLLRSRSGSTQP